MVDGDDVFMRNRDMIDRMMELPFFRLFLPVYTPYREQVRYLFFGGLTFFLSIGLFWLLVDGFALSAYSANAVDWIICVLFAYFTNRVWVFHDKASSAKGVARECGSFILGRLATLALEELVLWLGIDQLGLNSIMVKITAQVLVIIGNYLISKWLVFGQSTDGGRDKKEDQKRSQKTGP